jgi:hypothetical protein
MVSFLYGFIALLLSPDIKVFHHFLAVHHKDSNEGTYYCFETDQYFSELEPAESDYQEKIS